MKNKGLYIESMGVMILTLIVILVLYILSFNVNIFNVLKNSYKKIDLYDLYYSQLKPYDNEISDDIVLVNIGNHPRGDIARMIDEIHNYNPKVIGLDVFFKEFKNTQEDSLLMNSLKSVEDKLVVAYDIKSPNSNINKAFNLEAVSRGYSNFIGNGLGKPVRNINLKYAYENKEHYSFAYAVCKIYDPNLFEELDHTAVNYEHTDPSIINYAGGYDKFNPIEGQNILNGKTELDLIKDKIVIVGYFGSKFNSFDTSSDIHFTPMNKDGGNGIPDMHGALIHANIVQMIVDKNYVTHWPKGTFAITLLSIFLAYPFLVIFTYYFVRRHLWYHIIAKITQLVLGILLIFIALNLYDISNIKLELKFFLLVLAISVDVLYLYEAIAALIYKKYGKKSYFIHSH